MAVGGQIGFYGLSDWWLETFSSFERERILALYQPLGASEDYLTKARITSSSQSKISFLTNLATWLRGEENRHLAYACLEAAEPLFVTSVSPLDQHFALSNRCKVYYRWRAIDTFALPRAIEACQRSIDIHLMAAAAFRQEYPGPLPRHACFQQLAIIREKQGNFAGAVLLCDQAETAGWGGDWAGRRDRINQKWRKALGS